MNTGIFDKGVCELNRYKIIKFYLRKYFISDFFVNFVLFSSDSIQGGEYIDLIFFIKIRVFGKMLTKIEDSFHITQ